MFIGYARVSTQEQDNRIQIDALTQAGCETIYQEKISGGRWDRPEFQNLLSHVRKGDVVVVWKLDRLSRSLKDLLFTLERLEREGVHFRSLTEAIDTSTSAGRMMMQIIGSFAEFERSLLRERTHKGLEAARKVGRVGGRKPKLSRVQQEEIRRMILSGEKSAAEVSRLFKIHPSTVSRLMARG